MFFESCDLNLIALVGEFINSNEFIQWIKILNLYGVDNVTKYHINKLVVNKANFDTITLNTPFYFKTETEILNFYPSGTITASINDINFDDLFCNTHSNLKKILGRYMNLDPRIASIPGVSLDAIKNVSIIDLTHLDIFSSNR